jgi:hypothetical protein
MRTMGRCRLTSASVMGLETMLNKSVCREVLQDSESHTGIAVTALLNALALRRGPSLTLARDGRLGADVLAVE